MKRLLQLASLVVAVGALLIWLVTGANRGWTKTSREVRIMDEVVGIEKITSEKKFMPGLDFLWGAWLAGAIMAASSLFFRERPKANPENTESKNR